jgi:hypothetical protein
MYKILFYVLLLWFTPYTNKTTGNYGVDFNIIDQVFWICHILKKDGNTMGQSSAVCMFQTAYNSVRREALYKILNEFGITMKLIRQIKM